MNIAVLKADVGHVIAMRTPEEQFPVSRIWYRFHGRHTLEIGGMLTLWKWRRRGLATELFKAMLAVYPKVKMVTTPSATRLGRAWLLSRGFTHNPDALQWELDVDRLRNVNTIAATNSHQLETERRTHEKSGQQWKPVLAGQRNAMARGRVLRSAGLAP